MSNHLITVIVPTYRKFEFLRGTLHSIYRQDYSQIEILITDDGSDNYNEDMIRDLIAESPGHILVRVIRHPQNLGTVKNLNYAIREAAGEFICFLGSDDMLFKDSTLSEGVALFSGDTMVITGQMHMINQDGSPYEGSSFRYPSKTFYRMPPSFLYFYLLSCGNIYSAPGAIYRKSLFLQKGFYDEKFKYIEDFPYWAFLLRNAVPIKYIPQFLVKYRLGGISTVSSSSFQSIMREEEYQVYLREYNLLPDSLWGNTLKELIALRIKNILLPYDTGGIVPRHLRHYFCIRILRKGMALFKRIINILGG